MAVTLYRCERCRGVFASVFGVAGKNYCRNCKFNLNQPYMPGEQGSGGVEAGGGVTIVEPKEQAMGGGKTGRAIGGNAGDAQSEFAQQYQNAAGMQGLMGASEQQAFSGGSQFRSPIQYGQVGQRAYDQTTGTFIETMHDGARYHYSGTGECVAVVPPGMTFQRTMAGIAVIEPRQNFGSPPEPLPESSPHEAILKPSRKLKLLAE